ncbi:hypothetical protein ABTX81_33650 [Kitasatospora sp. NPDC097605]|uniref:hypothetical protein n=1 Tax=Kitasatospora sp. NPDC097605 TaxID=3157226 RepID=UPI00332F1673
MTETTTTGWTVKAPPRATSLFVDGLFPRRRALVVVPALLGGLLLAWLWASAPADGGNAVPALDRLLGHGAGSTPPHGAVAGVLFAFLSGLAGSFTAGNVAVFGVVGPLLGRMSLTSRPRPAHTLYPLVWLAAGMLPVSAGYGALVGLFGTRMPQFSAGSAPGTLPPGLVEAMAVFGVIGLVALVIGLAAAGVLPDPLAGVARRYPNAPLVLLGALAGALLAGRPHPLFRALFRQAALERAPLYGAVAFSLQSIGGVLVAALLLLVLSSVLGAPVQRWLATAPGRGASLTAFAFLLTGAFTVAYWDVRLPGEFGVLWWPGS